MHAAIILDETTLGRAIFQKYTVNQRLLVSANTKFLCDITMSRHHIDIMMIITIFCDSLCTNCRFLKTGLVVHIWVLQTPMMQQIDHISSKVIKRREIKWWLIYPSPIDLKIPIIDGNIGPCSSPSVLFKGARNDQLRNWSLPNNGILEQVLIRMDTTDWIPQSRTIK